MQVKPIHFILALGAIVLLCVLTFGNLFASGYQVSPRDMVYFFWTSVFIVIATLIGVVVPKLCRHLIVRWQNNHPYTNFSANVQRGVQTLGLGLTITFVAGSAGLEIFRKQANIPSVLSVALGIITLFGIALILYGGIMFVMNNRHS